MQFNLEKCKVMHVGRNNPEYELSNEQDQTGENGRRKRYRSMDNQKSETSGTVSESCSTRQSGTSEPKNLITQYARTELWKASFAIRVTEPWNTLPTELINADDGKAFQRMRKRYNK